MRAADAAEPPMLNCAAGLPGRRAGSTLTDEMCDATCLMCCSARLVPMQLKATNDGHRRRERPSSCFSQSVNNQTNQMERRRRGTERERKAGMNRRAETERKREGRRGRERGAERERISERESENR
eukprot:GHVU01004365.1.p1 GENE.GHVU01004365.1~~GHVU01004365.1.p1  ORF type:complete len:126 (-),score=19.47 GHVU01004365.1:334-711(-)